MLEETELEYESHAVNIGKDEQFEPDFLAICRITKYLRFVTVRPVCR